MSGENHGLFEEVIRRWTHRPDPTQALTPNQIASVTLGNGNPKNSARVGRMLFEYRVYFHLYGRGPGRKFSPKWVEVRRDFPGLFARPHRGHLTSPANPFDGMVQSLADEERAVRTEIRTHPIAIFEGRRMPEFEADGDIIYRFTYWQEREDGYFPIPDGVPVQLVWGGREFRDGVLLSEDRANWQLFVALDRPIERGVALSRGEIRPRLEELVAAVRRRVEVARDDLQGLQHRLLAGDIIPKKVRELSVQHGQLDPSQRDAVTRSCNHDVTFIWGPPGTGKTHTLGEVLAHFCRAQVRTLALSIANVAVDQICLKTRDALIRHGMHGVLEKGEVLRVGQAREPEVLRDERFFPNRTEARVISREIADLLELLRTPRLAVERRAQIQKRIADLRTRLRALMQKYLAQAKLVFTTVLQPCLDPNFDEVGKFDVVVVDEASMLPIPHLIASASRAGTQIVVVGDFRQLGPIALSNSEAAQEWLHRDVFDIIGVSQQTKPKHPALAMLRHQRRMHPDISRCINDRFYGGLLVDAAHSETTRASLTNPRVGRGVAFIDLGKVPGCVVEQTAAGSRRNIGSSERAATLAGLLVQRRNDLQVAVITPYRAQVATIKEHLKARVAPKDRERIRVGTIHTFQGSERDVVIWDWVENRDHRIGRLYRGREGDRLTNVAISRAKGKLLVLGDPRTFNEAPGHDAVRGIKAILHNHLLGHRISWDEAIEGG